LTLLLKQKDPAMAFNPFSLFPSPGGGGFLAGAIQQANLQLERAVLYDMTKNADLLNADRFYFADLTPLNSPQVNGGAIFALDEDTHTLIAIVAATGLEADRTHVNHIHGFANGNNATEATLAADADGDGFVEGAEGAPFYGPVLLDLTTSTAPGGDIWQTTTVQLPKQGLGANPQLDLREFNIHGMTVPDGPGAGTPGEVNGTGGYKTGLVVAGAEIEHADSFGELMGFLIVSGFAGIASAHANDGLVV